MKRHRGARSEPDDVFARIAADKRRLDDLRIGFPGLN